MISKNLIIVLIVLGLLIYFFGAKPGVIVRYDALGKTYNTSEIEPYISYSCSLLVANVCDENAFANAQAQCTGTFVRAKGMWCTTPTCQQYIQTGPSSYEDQSQWNKYDREVAACIPLQVQPPVGQPPIVQPPVVEPPVVEPPVTNLLDWIILSIRNFLCQYLHVLC